MKRKRRSISERMRTAKSPGLRLDIAHEWADEWQAEYVDLIDALKDAIDDNNMDEVRMIFAALRTLAEHKHIALHRIFNVLAQDAGNLT